jgi:hypothetical protein
MAFFAFALGMVIFAVNTNPGRLATLRANQHNIGDRHGCFKLHDPSAYRPATLSLALALVLLADIYSLNHDAMFIRQHLNDFAAFAFVFHSTADDFNGITFTNLYSHGYRSCVIPLDPALKNLGGQ